ncbi:MAG: transcriptional regulator, TetR family [Rhodospirillales bacterium]|jgi:AcrR family transcriptional regulator|nr:transcriptional regulator, TetR family [Rhodospirillales bacterium]
MASGHTGGVSRRDEYAEATRRAIVSAARQLFCEQGYFATRVDEIAALARVAPATVYAVAGGKQGLLRTLAEIWSAAPIITTMIARAQELHDPVAILRLVAASCRSLREDFGDIIRVLRTTAPHEKAVSESLAIATGKYRQAFVPIGQRLSELGALHEELDLGQAVDVLWFFFGYSGFLTLHEENGWSFQRAEHWLCREASRALLRDFHVALPDDQPSAGHPTAAQSLEV